MSAIWNLERLLGGKSEEAILKEINSRVEIIQTWRTLLDSFKTEYFLAYLKEDEQISLLYGAISDYYALKSAIDTGNDSYLSKMSSLEKLGTDISNKTMFFEIWLQSIPEEQFKEYLNNPILKDYKHYLERVRVYTPFTKDETTEQLLNYASSAGSNYSNLYDIITNKYSFKWEGKTINGSEIRKYIDDKDPNRRKKAYTLINNKYKEDSIVLNEIYRNIVNQWYNDTIKIRGYKTPISRRNMANDVDDQVVNTVLNVIRKNNDVFIDYFRFKWEFNGKKYKHSRYHAYAPLDVKIREKKYDYETGKKMVIDSYTLFDKEFGEKAQKIFDDNAVHSHPQDKKTGGAFCAHIPYQTPFVLLNHNDRLNDVSTIAHELGHGIHDLFANKQVYVSQHPTLPIAETASTFGEILLHDKLLSECKNKKEKVKLLSEQLVDCYRTITRQAYFVIFEKYAHDKLIEGGTKEDLDNEYMKLLKEQFGDMEIPEDFKHEWNSIPHIHSSPFYCYSYSFGYLLVLALYALYKKDSASFIPKYKEFLSSGSSKSISDLLSIFGLDPTKEEFWQGGFNIIKGYFTDLLELTD